MLVLVAATLVPARAATFTVRNTDDSGPDSLRQAILDSNASLAPDTIAFDIQGVGVHTIRPLSELPRLTGPTIIDGATQPGYANKPLVELTGDNAGPVNGLWFSAGTDGSTIRGLVINGFAGRALVILSGHNHVVANYIGTNAAGSAASPNWGAMEISGGAGNVIGGTSSGSGNLLQTPIDLFNAPGTLIAGNLIGTNATGTTPVGEVYDLFVGPGSDFTTIGGPSLSARNVILARVRLHGGAGSVIQGNYIGTDITGNVAFCNCGISLKGTGHTVGGPTTQERNIVVGGIQFYEGGGHMVYGNFIGVAADGITPIGGPGRIEFFDETVSSVSIGNTLPGTGNVIDGDLGHAVGITPHSTGIKVRGNTMIRTRARYGIDLNRDGETANDPGDADTGANNLQNYPLLTAASGASRIVNGTLDSTASTLFLVDFYTNTDPGSGRNRIDWVGSTTVTTNAAGIGTFSFGTQALLYALSATATDPDGNTSEFSPPLSVAIPTLQVPGLVLLCIALSAVAVATLRR